MKLKGILDTVLSTAVGLRQLAAQQSYGDACPTIPLWYSLMKAIGMASFEGAHILGEVPFILPRMSPCEASGQHKFDGIATMLVCLSIDKDEHLSSTPPTSLDDIAPKDALVREPGNDVELICAEFCNSIGDIESVCVSACKPRGEISMELLRLDELDDVSQRDEVEPSAHDSDANISIDDESSVHESDDNVSMDDESSAGESDEAISMDNESSTEESEGVLMDDESESTSETSVSSIASSIHIPFDTHILPGTGRRYSAMLPLICIADSDNIGMAISSILYQRRVWGIDEPVVGVSLSRTGTVARVLLGWLDLESDNNEFLPTPHIACADPDSEATTALGAYDLSDPIDALNFAQFIIGLDRCFDAIKTYTLNPRIQELPWRSDDVVISKLDDRAHSRVEQWAEEVAMTDPSVLARELHPPTSKPEFHILDLPPEISVMAKKKSSSVTFDEKSLNSSAASNTSSRTRERRPWLLSRLLVRAGLRAKSAISSSSLGKRTVGGLTDGLTMTTWLFERNVVGVGCVRISASEGLTLEEEEINAMIGAYEETTKFAWPKEWNNKNALPAVDPSLTHALATLYREHEEDATQVEELSIPFTNISRASGRRVNEAESRHDWDGVLYRFCVNTTEHVISAQILLERNLNFPRNRALDELNEHDADSLFGSFRTLADHNYQLCTAQHAVTSGAQNTTTMLTMRPMRRQIEAMTSDLSLKRHQ
ncbi:hypothetical protein A0H81_08667 [Grifola frondosa]|uniref:Uncharacterized protein n=1 Tax=Grifola frondosa TaxID=5627 RepID=A0A1C7M3N5_GRIFR|nr:hypothetical protein A0H81_08667 [Grifola frondosa]